MPTPEQHAVLSASSSARWLNCTASARLAEKCPRQDTAYTTAGTLAHKLAELKARKYFCGPMSQKDYRAELAVIQKDPAYDKGMDGATDLYLDHLKELTMAYDGRPFVALESRVDYSDWAPEGFGTADCLIISADKLCVVDYKNGAGVDVPAEDNSQMKLYALGALKLYAPIYGDSIQTISLSIVQPHAGGVKRWETTREDLMFWGKHTVWPRAQLAFHGEGTPKPGEWCEKTFCPMRHQCRAYGDWAAKLAFLPQTPPEQLRRSRRALCAGQAHRGIRKITQGLCGKAASRGGEHPRLQAGCGAFLAGMAERHGCGVRSAACPRHLGRDALHERAGHGCGAGKAARCEALQGASRGSCNEAAGQTGGSFGKRQAPGVHSRRCRIC